MATIKSFTSLEQSKKLAEILPLESADMVSPFRHTKNDEYIPEYVVSRNYIEVYNEMMKLPGMEKKDVCQLIQPAWSLATLLSVLDFPSLTQNKEDEWEVCVPNHQSDGYTEVLASNPIDACYEMILKLKERNLI